MHVARGGLSFLGSYNLFNVTRPITQPPQYIIKHTSLSLRINDSLSTNRHILLSSIVGGWCVGGWTKWGFWSDVGGQIVMRRVVFVSLISVFETRFVTKTCSLVWIHLGFGGAVPDAGHQDKVEIHCPNSWRHQRLKIFRGGGDRAAGDSLHG